MGIGKILFSGKGSLPVLEQAISFTEKRQVVLAQNLANVDTPGYMAKDLNQKSFQSMLQNAVQKRDESHPREFILESGKNFSVNNLDNTINFETYEPEDDAVLRHDQNNVTYESELTKIVQNGAAHRAYSKFIKGSFDKLTSAIVGR
jgi:flagellar basal-body rod protein FlgB